MLRVHFQQLINNTMAGLDKEQVWADVLNSLRVSVSSAVYSTWLSKTHLISLKKVDQKRYLAEIGCISIYAKGTIEQRYYGLLQDTLIKVIEAPTDLTFTIRSLPETISTKRVQSPAPLFESQRPDDDELMQKIAAAQLRPGFSFENFAVSSSNQMAHAAAEAVSRQPGQSYNPLFIWGGVGVGKTHLMHSVGYAMLRENANRKIFACSSEYFTNDVVDGIRNKSTQRVREKYRRLEALLIDDIQFIGGKDTVQEEFFHTFNALVDSGRQVILTADKPPSEITLLESRLRSRFEAGLIVDIAAPDFELRCAIIQIKAEEKGIPLEQDLVHLIAANITEARQIEGFLIKLSSEVKIKKSELNEDTVKSLLGSGKGIGDEFKKKNISPEKLIDVVCGHYSIGRRALLGKTRSRVIARPRQILMYILRTELGLPLEEVGRLVGGRDHSTVLHGVDKITELASEDVHIREDILQIKGNF